MFLSLFEHSCQDALFSAPIDFDHMETHNFVVPYLGVRVFFAYFRSLDTRDSRWAANEFT